MSEEARLFAAVEAEYAQREALRNQPKPYEIPRVPVPGMRTGRTTRMLEAAMKADKEGRAVYVLAMNGNHAKDLEAQFRRMYPDDIHTVKFETRQSLGDGLNEKEMKLTSPWTRNVLFVDHAYIERNYAPQLMHLLAFTSEQPLGFEEAPDRFGWT